LVASATVSHLIVGLDSRTTPQVSSSATPRLTWRVATASPNWRQSAYEVEVNGEPLGRVDSEQSANVPWPAAPIVARQEVDVRVRVWDAASRDPSPWSDPCVVVGGLSAGDWSARMIGPIEEPGTRRPGPGYLLRRAFELPAPVVRAHLHISAHGIFDVMVNGAPASDDVLAPGWTSYRHRLRYRTYDVSSLLRRGANVLGVELADGWYRGPIGFEGGRTDYYGDHLGVIAQLEIETADGVRFDLVTDGSWRSAPGAIVSTGLYAGERFDARLDRIGWTESGFDDHDWTGVEEHEFDPSVLEATLTPPVRRIERVSAVATERRGSSVRYDFGQNASGRLQVTASGVPGGSFTIRHAEVLEDGELATRPLRRAEATDQYTFAATDSITWEPRFTIHGFRYAEIWADPGVTIEHVEMLVLHSDMERTGWFECSDPLINRLHENVVSSMRANFVDVPTDCPQRDERLGWTGDIQVFSPTATFLFDCEGFVRSWLADVAHEQRELGTVPPYVPWIQLLFPPMPTCDWGDAAVLVPEALFNRYGDPDTLSTQFESMCTWVRQVGGLASANGRWDTGFQFGDWLDPAAPPDSPAAARTDPAICATAYLFRSARTLAGFAERLGRSEETVEFTALAERTRAAFAHEYLTPGGRLASDAQTAYALAIMFGLLEGAQLEAAGRRLAKLVHDDGYRIATGFIGTPLVCDALQRTGHVDVAYQLLNQRNCPSWLYPVTMGATSIWERWDSMLPDGSINLGDMTSFNHYALGAVADWLHRTVAGLAMVEPGGRRLRVAPVPGGGLASAGATLRTPYGMASVRWKRVEGVVSVEAVVPPNCEAVIEFPGRPTETVGSGTHRFDVPYRRVEDDPVRATASPLLQAIRDERSARNADADAR
jgi:alpha-L-rhamnosidase